MKNDFVATRLNVENFAKAAATLVGDERLARFDRLLEETQGLGAETLVGYSARGEVLHAGEGNEELWVHLVAHTVLPLTCQRCLGPVDVPMDVERSFRFVATEELAEELDEDSEDDILVSSRDFNLLELVEDELLMGLPAVPKHEVCPEPVKMQAVDADFVDEPTEKPNPFAKLEQLKKKKPD
jgi:uncharacterized protein